MSNPVGNLIVSIPHSGEMVPKQTPWLEGLAEEILMCDVDRYVDRLYEPALGHFSIPYVKTQWHRYAVDLNRIPEDVDVDSVEGAQFPSGTHNRGYHWVITTYKHRLMSKPMSQAKHKELTELIYKPFHQEVERLFAEKKRAGVRKVYHIDAHSMPSLGTSEHRDPGERRADIVISDCKGVSCEPAFRDLVIAAYVTAGFKVGYNWPYFGGRVTEQYGHPSKGQHSIQVELNRSLYMDEVTKKLLPEKARLAEERIHRAIEYILANIGKLA